MQAQRDLVQELQRRQILPIGGMADLLNLDEMQEIRPDLRLPHLFRDPSVMGGELVAVQQIIPPCRWGKALQNQVLFHAVAQLSHAESPWCERARKPKRSA